MVGNQFLGAANMGSDMRRAQPQPYQPGSVNPYSGGGQQQAAPAWSNDNPMSTYHNSQQASNDLMGGQWMSSGSLGSTRQAALNWTPEQKFFNGHVPGLDPSMFNQAAAQNQQSGVIQPSTPGAGAMQAGGGGGGGGGGAAGGVGGTLQSYLDKANSANESRYQQLLSMSGQLSNAASQREDKRLQNNLGRVDQNAISAGIGNSTVLPSMERGVQDDSALRQNEIADQGLRTSMGIIERRSDVGPDLNAIAGLAARPGAVTGGFGGGAVGGFGAMGSINPGMSKRVGSTLQRPPGPDTVSGGYGQQQTSQGYRPPSQLGDGLAPGLPPGMMQGQAGGATPGFDEYGNPIDGAGMALDAGAVGDPGALQQDQYGQYYDANWNPVDAYGNPV
jgi:hypothetical protein